MNSFISDLSGKEFPEEHKISGKLIGRPILEFIKREHPEFNDDSCLSLSELSHYRGKYISDFLMKEVGELSKMESKVLDSLKEKTLLTDKLEDEPQSLTFGQKIADKVATFGGSWTFIISFMVFLGLWIAVNAFWFANKSFDPYPFILLNLILSCIAALQAPVIMMSQNRQEEKDRERAKNDYMINLKSEMEIRLLHEKLDHLMLYQEQSLLEIQRIQIDMMNDILQRIEAKG